jgi:hypothetical protein
MKASELSDEELLEEIKNERDISIQLDLKREMIKRYEQIIKGKNNDTNQRTPLLHMRKRR